MTDYYTDDGERVRGAVVYGHLKDRLWLLLVTKDDGTRVVLDQDGDSLILMPIEATAESTTGPFIYSKDT